MKKLAVGMDLVDVIAKYSELPEGSLATFQITLQAGESWCYSVVSECDEESRLAFLPNEHKVTL